MRALLLVTAITACSDAGPTDRIDAFRATWILAPDFTTTGSCGGDQDLEGFRVAITKRLDARLELGAFTAPDATPLVWGWPDAYCSAIYLDLLDDAASVPGNESCVATVDGTHVPSYTIDEAYDIFTITLDPSATQLTFDGHLRYSDSNGRQCTQALTGTATKP